MIRNGIGRVTVASPAAFESGRSPCPRSEPPPAVATARAVFIELTPRDSTGGYGWQSWSRPAADDRGTSPSRTGPARGRLGRSQPAPRRSKQGRALRRVARAPRRRASFRPFPGKSGAPLAPGGPGGDGG